MLLKLLPVQKKDQILKSVVAFFRYELLPVHIAKKSSGSDLPKLSLYTGYSLLNVIQISLPLTC